MPGGELDCGNYRLSGVPLPNVMLACCFGAWRRLGSNTSSGIRRRLVFRHGFGTVHHLLVEQHLVAKHSRPEARPLVVIQIDFEKAFDKVPREHLWLRFQERGFLCRLLDAFMCAYDKVTDWL